VLPGGQGFLLDEDLAQGFVLVEDPRMHGGDELIAADEIQLQGQDAKQQVAVRVRLCHRRLPTKRTCRKNVFADRRSLPASPLLREQKMPPAPAVLELRVRCGLALVAARVIMKG
jgi:hypothetical protein